MKYTFHAHRIDSLISVCSALLLLMLSCSAQAEEWARLTKGLVGDSFKDVVFDKSHPNTLYAASGAGRIYKSTNGGASWVDRSAGLPATTVTSIAIDPNNGTVYAGTTGNGVYFSANGGDSWASNGLPAAEVQTLAIGQGNPAVLYAGTKSGLYFGYSKVSGAAPWVPTLAGKSVYSIAVAPSPSNHIYAGVLDPTDQLGKLFRGANGGAWVEIDTGLSGIVPLAIAVDPASPATVYVGGGSGNNYNSTNGIYKSTNNGTAWTKLTLVWPSGYPVMSLAIEPGTPSTLYAGWGEGWHGLINSRDGGASWENFGVNSDSINKMAINPSNPLFHVVATETGGVKKNIVKSDVNGDGKSDIFVQDNNTNELQVWIMDGTQIASTVTIDPNARLPAFKTPWKIVATGDFDGDGLADPVMRSTTNSNQYAVWFISRSPGLRGTYVKTGQILFSGLGDLSRLAGVGDFNGDGLPDLFWEIGEINPHHQIWYGNGQNTWPTDNRRDFSNFGSNDGFFAGLACDLNGDGHADIVLHHGSFPDWDEVWTTGSPPYGQHFYNIDFSNIYQDPTTELIGTGDFNGDGKMDLLWKDPYYNAPKVTFMDGNKALGVAIINFIIPNNLTLISK